MQIKIKNIMSQISFLFISFLLLNIFKYVANKLCQFEIILFLIQNWNKHHSYN